MSHPQIENNIFTASKARKSLQAEGTSIWHVIVSIDLYNEEDDISTLSGALTWRLCSKLALNKG
jgi:hypothetical protein